MSLSVLDQCLNIQLQHGSMPQCLTPMDVRIKETNRVITVPCGKCVNCILRKGSEWSFRLMQEEKHCETAYFITFTYANQYVPITEKKYMGLDKSHLQDFFKSLRHRTTYRGQESRLISPLQRKYYDSLLRWHGKPIKYYAVGEYGGKTKRPHYHAIIFNADLELIFKSWNYGDIHVGTVTPESCGYCMKYMLKKGTIPEHRNDDRPKEFALMSKHLGMSYITPQTIQWHNANHDRLYVSVPGGIKCSMPRYYKERIFSKDFREIAGLKQLERMEKERYTKRIDAAGNIWYDYTNYYMEGAKIQAALQSNLTKRYLSSLNNYL